MDGHDLTKMIVYPDTNCQSPAEITRPYELHLFVLTHNNTNMWYRHTFCSNTSEWMIVSRVAELRLIFLLCG